MSEKENNDDGSVFDLERMRDVLESENFKMPQGLSKKEKREFILSKMNSKNVEE